MNQDIAEALALQIFAYIVGEAGLCGRFLDLTGLGHADLKSRISEPAFLGSVVEFILADEASLMEFCAAADIDPRLPARAHVQLMGNPAPDWS